MMLNGQDMESYNHMCIGEIMINLIKSYTGFNKVKSKIINGTRDEKWVYDLETVKKQLPKGHKNLFFKSDETSFYTDIQYIIDNVSNLSDEEIKVLLMKLVAGVNDGHSVVLPGHKEEYPLRYYFFDDGVYLIKANKTYESFIGGELLSVNGHCISEVIKRLESCTSADNYQQKKNRMAYYLYCPLILQGLDLVKDELTLVFKVGNEEKSVQVKSCLKDDYELIEGLKMTHNSFLSKNYWYESHKEENFMYFQYNSCMRDKEKPFKNTVNKMFNEMDEHKIDNLIVDVRHNGGGMSWIIRPLFKGIKERPHLNQKDNLFLIIGRRTFSSALMNTIKFMNKTNATLVGENTGGAPNGYGELHFLKLMNTGVEIPYSTQYFKQVKEDIQYISPDIEVKNLASDYYEGRDMAIEVIKSIIG